MNNTILIFTKKALFPDIESGKKTGFLYRRNKKAFRCNSGKKYICFYSKDCEIIKEIEYIHEWSVGKTYIMSGGCDIYDNFELAKIAFSLGIKLEGRQEREKIIKYVKDKFGLPFNGWYVKIKEQDRA